MKLEPVEIEESAGKEASREDHDHEMHEHAIVSIKKMSFLGKI